MAAKTSWHRYGTKLHHCCPMYTGQSIEASERERLYIEQKDSREKKYFCYYGHHQETLKYLMNYSQLNPTPLNFISVKR